jgi:hypothetical protein
MASVIQPHRGRHWVQRLRNGYFDRLRQRLFGKYCFQDITIDHQTADAKNDITNYYFDQQAIPDTAITIANMMTKTIEPVLKNNSQQAL